MDKDMRSFLNNFLLFIFIVNWLPAFDSLPVANKTKTCPEESSCILTGVPEDDGVCMLDYVRNCIRRYKSLCHLEIAACHYGKNFTGYSNVYCSMDSYFCEEGFERWTIFFGYEEGFKNPYLDDPEVKDEKPKDSVVNEPKKDAETKVVNKDSEKKEPSKDSKKNETVKEPKKNESIQVPEEPKSKEEKAPIEKAQH